jgi:phage terminase large subunit
MTNLQIPTAEVFVPLLDPARYKGADGGRGSGKSHFFAGLGVEDALRFPGEAGEGMRWLCGREIQKSLQQSAKHLIETKINDFGLGEKDGFKIFKDVIQLPGDGICLFQGLQDHTSESIKSFEGIHRFWNEEAQTTSAQTLKLIRPTIRWEDKVRGLKSELWFSWNGRRKLDPVDIMFKGGNPPTGSKHVRSNWNHNPWFPDILNQERMDCLNNDPDQYDHIWEGDYVSVMEGAYFAKHLKEARAQGRIGRVGPDPLITYRAFCDLGGTGARADAFTIWIAQFVNREIRVLNYYEAQGQDMATHITWLRANGYNEQNTGIWLPHDGSTNDRVHDVSFESAFKSAGFAVEVIPNQGKGAAKARIEAGRRLFPLMWFNEDPCSGGLDALGWYHEKKDEKRDIGLGPDHDWSSHGADAFGLMAVAYEQPRQKSKRKVNSVADHMNV